MVDIPPPLLWLDEDALREVFKHVELPMALKLACRATRAAAPDETTTDVADVLVAVPLVRWARALGCPLNAYACICAAQGGKLGVLKWLRANGCEKDGRTCEGAAWGGHLDCLKWAHEHGCEWDCDTCSNAARGGHLDCLVWAREHGCECGTRRKINRDELHTGKGGKCVTVCVILGGL